MILEEETYRKFGYWPKELTKGSHKKVIAKCDTCGKIRESEYKAYRQLCFLCSVNTEEYRKNRSESNKGKSLSEETKAKISQSLKNIKPQLTDRDIKFNKQMTQMLEQETYNRFGYYPSELKFKSGKRILVECKRCKEKREISKSAYHELCLSCSHIGRQVSQETKEKIRKANTGKKVSEETRKKLQDSHMGIHPTEASRQKMSEANKGAKHHFYGKHLTKEHKQKLSEARKGRFGGENHPFYGKQHTDATKEKMSKNRKGQNCGSNHHNWKGGISALSFIESHKIDITEWEKIAKTVRKRDRYICQYCGKKNSTQVHHIIPRNVEIDNSLENLITLCRECHPKVEKLTNKYLEQNRNPIEIFYEKWSK